MHIQQLLICEYIIVSFCYAVILNPEVLYMDMVKCERKTEFNARKNLTQQSSDNF